MQRNKREPTQPQIKKRLKKSAEAIRTQGKQDQKQRARRQKAEAVSERFVRPLTPQQMKMMMLGLKQARQLGDKGPGTVIISHNSIGSFDRENSHYIIDCRTASPQILNGPFQKHRVAYIHNLQGKFLHKLTYLKRNVMSKLKRASKKEKGWIDLGNNWKGRFNPENRQYQVSKTMERGTITKDFVFAHDQKGREIF